MKINFFNEVGARVSLFNNLIKLTERDFSKIFLKNSEVNLYLVSKSAIKKVNQKFRGINKVTDVISYSLSSKDEPKFEPNIKLAGEILISYEVAKAQAQDLQITIRERLLQLIIHGLLHVAGFDHEGSKAQSLLMEEQEDQHFSAIYSKLCL